MKMIIAFAALVAAAVAAPQGNPQDAVIVKETPLDNIGVDGYNFGYEQSDGQARQESGQLINAGTDNEAIVVSGTYTFTAIDTGEVFNVHYTADENGFHPEGSHLPA